MLTMIDCVLNGCDLTAWEGEIRSGTDHQRINTERSAEGSENKEYRRFVVSATDAEATVGCVEGLS